MEKEQQIILLDNMLNGIRNDMVKMINEGRNPGLSITQIPGFRIDDSSGKRKFISTGIYKVILEMDVDSLLMIGECTHERIIQVSEHMEGAAAFHCGQCGKIIYK